MGFKLLLLAVMGLGALYLFHLLAQDYMKIRKPAAKLARFLLTKRDLSNEAVDQEFHIDWNRILKNDPLKCTQSLICQIVAGAEAENKDVLPMIYLLEYAINVGAPEDIEMAYRRGTKLNGSSEKCHLSYTYCPYSARAMLKILNIYSYIFGD